MDILSHMLYEFWVEKGEACELILVQIHHEQLVRGGQLRALTRELAVKVGNIFPVALQGNECLFQRFFNLLF